MSTPSTRDLAAQIRALRDLSTAELRVEWLRVTGKPTTTFNGAWLREKLARTLRARGAPGDRVALNRAVWSVLHPAQPRPPRPRDPRIPPTGAWLRRDYADREIAVKVMRTGFRFDGRVYRSLSAIAREVTGARWNGLLFFGLAERTRGKRKCS